MGEDTRSPDIFGIAQGYTPAEDYIPSTEDEELVGQIQGFWDEGYEHRLPYERQWELFRLFLKGEQLLYRDKTTGDVVRVIDYDNKRLYSINNQLRPTARSLTGKLAAMMPTYHIVPATGEQEEIHGAQAGSMFFKYFRRKLDFETLYLDSLDDLMWSGIGIIEMGWDPQGGRAMATCPECDFVDEDPRAEGEECPVCAADVITALGDDLERMQLEEQMGMPGEQEEGQPPPPIPQLIQAHEGEVFLTRLDPRDLVVEPGVMAAKDLRWACSRVAVPVTEARRRFRAMAPFIRAESGIYSDRAAKMTYATSSGSWGSDFLEDHVYLYTYYERPTAMYERGRVVWMINNMIVEEVEGLFEDLGRLPLFFQFWERNAGEFYPESFIYQAWHRQKELNEAETQMREASELLARTKVVIPRQANVSADEFTATTAQAIVFNDAVSFPPHYMVPPPIPTALLDRRRMLIEDIRIQGATTDQDMGAAPADPNGRAMAILEAEANRQLGPVLKRNWREMGELHRCCLILARKMYSFDRQMLVVGEFGHEVVSMNDIDLAEGWDVEVELDDGLSQNQAVRIQQVMQLVEMQLMNDQMTNMPDTDRIAQMARLKIPGQGPDISSSEYAAAQNLIRQIEHRDFEGALSQVGPEDDPNVFSTALINWLRKKGRRPPFVADQEIKQLVRELYMYYTEFAMSGQMGQLPQSPMGPGGGGAQGGPADAAAAQGPKPANTLEAEASEDVAQADEQGEGLARQADRHES